MQKLTAKQEMFVKEYMIDLNATQAAIRAGYSENTARQIGADCLSKVVIQEAIAIEMKKRSERVEITADDILKSLMRVRNISEQEVEREEAVDMLDKNSVIKVNELLGKHLSMWTDKVEHSGNLDTTINIVRARKGD